MRKRLLVLMVRPLVCLAAPLRSVRADPARPTAMEVDAVTAVLKFRGGMLREPAKTIAAHSAGIVGGHFVRFGRHMETAGSGAAGWRFLLGTSVFTVVGADQARMLAVFYNPWVDSALVTQWERRPEGQRIVDAEWVAGDLVRRQADIDPRPLWLRGQAYRPDALAQAVVTTTRAITASLGDGARVAAWRNAFGVRDAMTYDRLVVPMLALALAETQMRLKALAVATPNEDARLPPLRTAVKELIATVSRDGFAKPLAAARDTTAPMRAALAKLNAKTLQGLGPIAFVVGDGHATVFLGSTMTADYVVSARFTERVSGYALQQLEFIAYAATYQAALQAGEAPR